MDQSFSATEDEVNLHSVRFSSPQPFDPGIIDLSQFESVKRWDSRVSVLANFHLPDDVEESYTSPTYGIPVNEHPTVSDVLIQSGNYLSGEDQAMVEQSFLEGQELELGDSIIMNLGQQQHEFEIVGTVFSAEFLYNVNPKTGLPDLTNVAPVWLSVTQLQDIMGLNGSNELLVRFQDSIHHDETQRHESIEEVKSYLQQAISPQITSVALDEEGDQQMKEGDLGALDDFARVFGGVVLLIALFAIYDNISKMIASQRNYIGTMRAMGGSKRGVTLHYTQLAMLLATLGTVIGIPLGLLISYGMVTEYAAIIGIPSPEVTLRAQSLLEATGIIMGLSLLISLLTASRAASIEPREAMSSAYITQVFRNKPLIERILAALGTLSPTTAIPIRNIFRNKRKAILTILTFALSIVLMVAALGFMDSFNATLQQNYEDRQMYDMEVYLASPMLQNSVNQMLDSIPDIDEVEGFVSTEIAVTTSDNSSKTTSLYAFQTQSNLRAFDLMEGDLSQAVIPSLLASDLNLSVGDDIQFLGQEMQVSGIANEVISESVFVDLDTAQNILGLHQNITGIILTLEDGADRQEVEQKILETLPVALIISTETVKASIEYLIQGIFAMIGVMVFIGFLTVALFSFNTIVLEIISRENEFVNMKSLGASNRKLLGVIVLQSLLVSITGSILSIPLSLLVTDQVIQAMMADLMQIDTVISLPSYAIAIGSALLASTTGIIAAYRHVKNIDLVDALRNRVSN